MDKASNSTPNSPDVAEEFERAIQGFRKKMYENIVLEKTVSTWFKLQELQAYREGVLPLRGPVATRKLETREKKYQQHLGVARASNIFVREGVYFLMLLKEQKVLRRIGFSEVFMRTCAGNMYAWISFWRSAIDREIDNVKSQSNE